MTRTSRRHRAAYCIALCTLVLGSSEALAQNRCRVDVFGPEGCAVLSRRSGKAEPEYKRIERTVRKVDEATHRRPAYVTQRVRPDGSAHGGGRAIDLRSRGSETDQEAARDYSTVLRQRHSVLVEEPDFDRDEQTNTFYQDGIRKYERTGQHYDAVIPGNKASKQYHATGPHIHIQADTTQRRNNAARDQQHRQDFYRRFYAEQFGESVQYQSPTTRGSSRTSGSVIPTPVPSAVGSRPRNPTPQPGPVPTTIERRCSGGGTCGVQ